ncbi:MAG: PAS domain S-box protein [Chloroflexi bacterium]|nr:PAS domain S-box protein [Chloroflexota bacterium]
MTATTGQDARKLERLRAALNFAGVGAWEWDLRSGEAWWSDHVYAILGRSRSDIPTTLAAFIECVVEEDRESVQGALRAVLQTGEPHAFVCRVTRPDGTLRVCRGQPGAVLDETGRCRRILGAIRNTTLEDAVRSRPDDLLIRALREQRSELLTLVESAPVALILADSSRRILRTNRATERMLGWRSAELAGRGLETLFAEPEEILDALLLTATTDSPEGRITRVVSLVTREGWPLRAEMTLVPAPKAEGARFAVTLASGVVAVAPADDLSTSPWDELNHPRVDAPASRR